MTDILAVGDGANDLPMILAAGLGSPIAQSPSSRPRRGSAWITRTFADRSTSRVIRTPKSIV